MNTCGRYSHTILGGISSLSWVLCFMEEIKVALLHYLANSNVQRGWEVLSWSW